MTDIASHRGGALLWPENSRIAFENTARLAVEQVEFDVHPTRDGKLVVIHDELDLPFGTIRLKLGGGDNGHNGLRSLTTSLGSRDYYRVRFGIGRPPGRSRRATGPSCRGSR